MRYVFDHIDRFFDGRAKWIWSREGIWGESIDPRPIQCRYFARPVRFDSGQRLLLAISADTRYMLYLNGRIIARGPQKGDVAHQFYDVLDLTDDVAEGENLLLVRVDSSAKSFPYPSYTGPSASEMSAATLFVADGVLLDPDGSERDRLFTDESWLVRIDPALSFHHDDEMHSYVGFKESIDFTRLPAGFYRTPDFDDGTWEPATVVHKAYTPETAEDAFLPHRLTLRSIRPLHHEEYGFTGVWCVGEEGPEAELDGEGALRLTVPPNTRVSYILDAGRLYTAYPLLSMDGGHGSRIRLKYAERLLRNDRGYFGPYDSNCSITGYSDHITAGNGHAFWSPLHWRTFRYIELSVETDDEPLTIGSLHFLDCHYPISPLKPFRISDEQLNRFWDIGLRTQQACAHETYEDCPYYEQLQYGGDTQAQILYTYAVSGVTCLPRQAIRFFHWSQLPEGLTQSRYPSRPTQVIPYWSLHYLFMLYDWYMYTGDVEEIREEVLGGLGVLRWFLDRRDETGLVGKLQYWCVADWSPEWGSRFRSRVPGAKEGPTALTNLMVIAALEQIGELLHLLGEKSIASSLKETAGELRLRVQELFWKPEKEVYIDSPLYEVASQLTNAWAILIDLPDAPAQEKLAETIGRREDLCQAAYFGQLYLFNAWQKTGRSDLVVGKFDSYRSLVEQGVTTWPENPGRTRSECHAWSNAASYHLLRTILGFSIAEPGCRRLNVRPYLDGLGHASGTFATPWGGVSLSFDRKQEQPFEITVPKGVEVSFSYEGMERVFGPGEHQF